MGKSNEKLNKNNIENILSLSPMQEGMLFYYLLNKELDCYMEQLQIEVTGKMNVELFEKAWNIVVQTNEVLRTVFRWENLSKPIQVVLKSHKVKVLFKDISEYQNLENAVIDIVEMDRKELFDLIEVPFRITLCKLNDSSHRVIITNHHILYDGWSNGIIMKEFFETYNALVNQKSVVPVLKTKFHEYIKWIGNINKNEQRDYWKEYLKDFEPKKIWERSISKEGMDNKKISSYMFDFTAELVNTVNNFARFNDITIASFLYSAWGVLLLQYGNENDVTFGTTVSVRPSDISGIENVVGLCINTVPLRMKADGSENILDFLSKINSSLQERKEYEVTPLTDIMTFKGIKSGDELFQSIFVIENYPLSSSIFNQDGILNVESFTNFGRSHYDITVIAKTFDNIISLEIQYNSFLFKESFVEKMAKHYKIIFEELIAKSGNTLSSLNMLSQREKDEILLEFNNTECNFESGICVHEYFEKRVVEHPDKIAVIDGTRAFTYHELNERANQLARLILRKNSITPDTSIGIITFPSMEMIIGILAVLKAGGAYVPIDPGSPADRNAYILQDSDATMLLISSDITKIDYWDGDVLYIDGEVTGESGQNLGRTSAANNLAYIIYTSGSTGHPKGVMIEHKSVVNILLDLENRYPVLENDTYLLKTTYTFDVSVTEIMGWFMGRGRLAVLESGHEKDPIKIIDAIEAYNVTHINIVPSMFKYFLEYIEQNKKAVKRISSLKYIISAGEALPADLVNQFKKLHSNISLENLYGPTEATIYATHYSLKDFNGGAIVPIGKPMSNLHTYIVDRHNRLQPIGVPGELCLSGVGISRGYVNREQLTKEKFVSNLFIKELENKANISYDASYEKIYRTGDLARWMPDGNIEYLGRNDFQIKIRGFRIEIEEIEYKLFNYEKISAAIVTPQISPEGSAYLCAYYTATSKVTDNEIINYLSESLPHYMIPSYFVRLKEFPLNSNGKINRKALPMPELTHKNYEPPNTDLEKKLIEIWSEVLEIDLDKIGANSDFFHIGGHSLLATRLILRIHKEMNQEVTLSDIFNKPTIRELGMFLEQQVKSSFVKIPKAEKKDYYILSHAQKRLFMLHLLDKESISYNMAQITVLEGYLDKKRVEDVLIELIKRHEILRTSFMIIDGEPQQKINEEITFKLEYVEGNRDKEEELVHAFVRPFDLTSPHLIRAGIAKTSPERYLLMIDMHHIIADGMSHLILLEEFVALYSAQELDKMKIQYKDFSEWQDSEKKKENFKLAQEFWLKEFSGELPVLNLPQDSPRPVRQSFQGASIKFDLSPEQSEGLKRLGMALGLTPYMMLLGIINILISKLSGQEDIIIGTPVAGRTHSDMEPIVGLFVNTLALRNTPAAEKRVENFLKELKTRTVECFKNQDYPFEDLVDKVDIKRDMSRNPLFDVWFSLHNMDVKEVKIPGIKSKPFEYENQIAKFDLSFHGSEVEDRYCFTLEYCVALFSSKTVERYKNYFLRLINTFLNEGVDMTIGEIELISEEEKILLDNSFNNTRREYDRTGSIQKLFETCVSKYSEKTAVVWNGKEHSYAELNGAANCVATELQKRGVNKGSIVCLIVERSFEMIAGLIGILKAGGAYIPVDSEYPVERIDYIVEDSKADLILTNVEKYYNIYKEMSVDLRKSVRLDLNLENPPVLAESEDLAYVIYTSGSTGRPKGVMIENHSVVNFITGITEQISFDNNDKILSLTTVSFDIFALETLLPLVCGSKVILGNREEQVNGEKASVVLSKEQISIFQTTPSRLQILMEDKKFCTALGGLKVLLVGGEAFPVSLMKKLKKIFKGKIYNMYGPTETTIWSTMKDISGEEALDIGKPIANNQVYIMSKECRNLQPLGVVGELCIAGESLARGYLNRPALTKERFVMNPFKKGERLYRTGDLARWKTDGNIEFLGRMDNQVKVRGYRIELGEIETVMMGIVGVEEAVVISREVNESQELFAYFTGQEDMLIGDLKEGIAKKLPHYMIPSYFTQLKEIPLNPNGKIDRNALPMPKITRNHYEPPKTDMERKVAEIWKEVLQVDKISIFDNFFDIGGNSLKLIRVVNKLKEVAREDVSITTLFQYPTVQSLVSYLGHSEHNISLLSKDEIATQYSESSKSVIENDSEIAIIGMACRFPDANNVEEFWNKLKNGIECITYFNDEELLDIGVSPDLVNNPSYVKAQGVMPNPEYFDAEFFKYSPREAEIMDPQIRVFHEIVWEALEDSGYSSKQSHIPIGLFSSASPNLYWEALVALSGKTQILGELASEQLFNKDYMSTRISYKLNLTGPSVSLYTACSSSLVAVHVACESLLKNDCDIAIAGSSTISPLPDKTGYLFQDGMVKSSDGHCRTFDINADGFVQGTGAGAVVLKKLSKAIEDRDNIYAVIKATEINNDGSNKLGYTAPSVDGQKNVIQSALKKACIPSESIQYIEAHGTATPLGDTVEIEALKQVFNTNLRNFCGIGSVKSNIGHLDCTSGVAGLIKTVLAIKHRLIPPTLNVTVANPKLNLIDSPFYLVTEPTEWKNSDIPLRAGISSLGLGGTNAHVIIEEPPVLEDQESVRIYKLILLSARTEFELNKQIKQLSEHLDNHPQINMADLAYTLQTGRTHFAYRMAFAIEDRVKAIEYLNTGLAITNCTGNMDINIVFVFLSSGIKNIIKWMELYKTESIFKKEIDECLTALSPYIEPWFISAIDNQVTLRYEDISAVKENPFILFCIQYAFAKTLISWGIRPDNIKGDGMEEAIKIALSNTARFEEISSSIVSKLKYIEQNPGSTCCGLESEELSDTKSCIYIEFGKNDNDIETTDNGKVIQFVIDPSERLCISNQLFEKLGQLWMSGVAIDWEKLYSKEKRKRVSLPTYPFERQRYWINGNPFKMTPIKGSEALVKKQDISDWFYVPLWEQSLMSVISDSDSQENFGWMVFMDDTQFHTSLVNELEARVGTVIKVRKGIGFGKSGENEYHINFKEENSYALLLDELAVKGIMPGSIVSLWSVSDSIGYEELTQENIYTELDSGFFSITYLAKALANQSSAYKTRIIVVTSNMHNVDGSDRSNPAKAAVLGPCKVIPQELSFVRCRNIDISIPEEQYIQNKLIQKLICEMQGADIDTVVAYRNNIRYIQKYTPTVLPKNNTKFKEKGVYFITGGMGNIGFSIADYLANNYYAKVILIGRSAFPKRGEREKWLIDKGEHDPLASKVKRVIELEKQGAEIYTYSGDISDYSVIYSVVEDAERQTGKINGVIHAAGAMRDSLYKTLNEINREDCEKQFVSKIFGTMVLYRLFRDKELDFFTVTSSTSSALGGLGFAAYSAANIFMDSFISEFNRSSGKDWISVNWEGWKFSVERTQMSFNFSLRELFMEPEEGVEVFKYVTNNHGFERILVSSGNMDDRINTWIKLSAAGKDVGAEKTYQTKIDREGLKTSYVSPENKMEENIAEVFQDFFGYKEISIHDNFFDIGASSLDMIQITGNLRKALNMNIPILKLFSFPTIHSLAQNLAGNNEEDTTSSRNIDRTNELNRGKNSIQRRYNLRKK
ncbi:hypothetical protein acsn021_37430 [Anaerocolumna cellulosilytica]|uniref:Uncharacterized protein n=1 Tax=Anaerocolumna cellulosilytica TaxID=433286 RepID=A0A6S6QZT2_9FIRM|nr:non-ribosomal peptide synthetase [Anaerocolumna cellulosilytica]MBB5194989.1 amino acid adenylation domain-containing protein [Anaerocolumna cellulosilytica]BCJ96174.1 hypothetical protein acsn021_37430 [Anaerocolumna cellulosilytica]